MDELRVRLFGGLSVDGLTEQQVGSRQARTVVKVLTLARGTPVAADRLIDALWPESLPAKPVEQLRVLTSRLRAVLGADRLVRSDAGWSLRVDWFDAAHVEGQLTAAQTAWRAGDGRAAITALVDALECVRGGFLADEPEAPWADAERRGAARLVGDVRRLAAEVDLALGDHAAAAARARAALDDDPYDEPALAVLMRAEAAAGRPASALAAYAEVRHRLAEDLGVGPSADVEAVHEQLLVDGTVAAQAAPAAAAPPVAVLVGRDAHRAALDAALAGVTTTSAVVELVGEPGSGKTFLARTWADGVRDAALVLTVACRPVGVELPLQSVLDALDAHLRSLGPDASAAVLGADAAVLAGLLGGAPPTARTSVAVSEAERRAELLAALVRIVERAASGRRAVVLVDDVDRGDASTLAWVAQLVRRTSGVLVVATRPADGAALGGAVLAVGPLDLDAVARLAGADRAAALLERTGGQALAVTQLAAEPPGALPPTLQFAVVQRAVALGPQADEVLRAAAVLDSPLDVDLLGALVGQQHHEVSRGIDRAVTAGLLVPRDGAVVFRHELLRECLAEAAAGRATLLHREAARLLSERPRHDPSAVVRHVCLGGDGSLARPALIAAARQAVDRHDAATATALLDEAVALGPDPSALVARARLRMAVWDHARAAQDIEAALELGAGLEAWELAGWIAYYRRDHAAAVRYAETALELAADDVERASGATLLGRIEHTRGHLARADALLTGAVAAGSPGTRGMARVWLALLRGHQGRATEAADLAERGLLTARSMSHPFGHLHGLFAVAYAAGIAGDAAGLRRGTERMAAAAAADEIAGRRFLASANNLRGWFRRATGDASLDEQDEQVAGLPLSSEFAEQRVAGLLDLAEHALVGGDLDATHTYLDTSAWVEDWVGSMAWHQRQRWRALRARAALADDDRDVALEHAAGVHLVVADADSVRAMRYAVLARLIAAQAGAHDGLPAVVDDLRRLDEVSGLDGWLVAGDVVAALGLDQWWPNVDASVARIRRSIPDDDTVVRFDRLVTRRMTAWHR